MEAAEERRLFCFFWPLFFLFRMMCVSSRDSSLGMVLDA
jgi:hypothetical protein